MKPKLIILSACTAILLGLFLFQLLRTDVKTIDARDYGIAPEVENNSANLVRMMARVRSINRRRPVIIRFEQGIYNIKKEGAERGEFYISNHDHVDTLSVALWLRNLHRVIIEGNGALFMVHGELLPVALQNTHDCKIRNLRIDYRHPHIVQVEIKENRGMQGILFELAPFYNYRITDSKLVVYDEDVLRTPYSGIAFNKGTKHLLEDITDLDCNINGIQTTNKGRLLYAPQWYDHRLKEGTIVCLRTWDRPTPCIFVEEGDDISIENVKVHYADGMGLLAQGCDNITLDAFSVCISDERRYFTTQADATHFSGCKGVIVVKNGLFEGMMDDAINVHGTYLGVENVISDSVLEVQFKHHQSFGFKWCDVGDTIQLIDRETMKVQSSGVIKQVENIDRYNLRLTLERGISLDTTKNYGVENLTRTPNVEFINNVVRNNRARGSLFSTPRNVLVENNEFNYVSGTAVLLCGDCNGWYESGACRDVTIKNNLFKGVLTSRYQFCEGIISICPVVPRSLADVYFHGNVNVENNKFEVIAVPVVYASSTEKLFVEGNDVLEVNGEPKNIKSCIKTEHVKSVIVNGTQVP